MVPKIASDNGNGVGPAGDVRGVEDAQSFGVHGHVEMNRLLADIPARIAIERSG